MGVFWSINVHYAWVISQRGPDLGLASEISVLSLIGIGAYNDQIYLDLETVNYQYGCYTTII